jgi:molybdopterin/thiamine biosynthesis adenylyltransferase
MALPQPAISTATAGLEADSAFMDKYSRQIGAYGLEAMSKLLNMRVLIAGLKGVGMETAKNLALAGPGAITLWDDAPAAMRDLGGNFFLNQEDVGKPRAAAVAARLQELNQMVAVRVHQVSPICNVYPKSGRRCPLRTVCSGHVHSASL